MVVFLLFLGLVLSSCGSGDIPQQSPLDTAENHYQRGLVYVERAELIKAHREFARAQLLEKDYPGSYVGFALVSMTQGQFWQARQKLEKALHLERKYADAHTTLGRVVMAEGLSQYRNIEDWLPEALRAFKKAEAVDPQNSAVFWHRGQAFL
jgi:Tfp pilus assembly protein PilF